MQFSGFQCKERKDKAPKRLQSCPTWEKQRRPAGLGAAGPVLRDRKYLVARGSTRRRRLLLRELLGQLLLGLGLLLVAAVHVAGLLGPTCAAAAVGICQSRHELTSSNNKMRTPRPGIQSSDRARLCGVPWERSLLTLLGHAVVGHGGLLLGRVSAAAVLLLGGVHLRVSGHGVALLRIAVGHLRHAGGRHATVTTAHAVATHAAAAAGRVAATGAVVGGFIDANGAAIESICALEVRTQHQPPERGRLRRRGRRIVVSYSMLFMAAIARWASSSFV